MSQLGKDLLTIQLARLDNFIPGVPNGGNLAVAMNVYQEQGMIPETKATKRRESRLTKLIQNLDLRRR